MDSLQKYGSDSSSSGDDSDNEKEVVPKKKEPVQDDDSTLHLRAPQPNSENSVATAIAIQAAPSVAVNEKMDLRSHIDPSKKEIDYNPRYDELFAPVAGPAHPFKTQQEAASKNMLSGYTEPSHLNEFQFELQRRTFHSYGFAQDPSNMNNEKDDDLIIRNDDDKVNAENQEFKSVFEVSKVRPLDKRKRKRNDDASDIDGYLGPWAKYADEETVSKPEGEDAEYLEEYLSKMNSRGKKQSEDKPIEEKSQLHIKDAYDYQNRSFLHIPQDVGINLKGKVICSSINLRIRTSIFISDQ